MNVSSIYQDQAERIFGARCVLGGCGSGKTSRLVDHVADLLGAGAQPDEIVVFVSSPAGKDPLRSRLRKRVGVSAAEVRVVTARELALEVLGTRDAERATGRKARMLFPFEVNMIMEDLKTTGIRAKRLKEMLKFFYRGWTELSDLEDGWLIYKEERCVHDGIKGRLAAMQAVMEPEVSNLAVTYLLQDERALRGAAYEHVVVDDFGLMSRASQALSVLLARGTLTIAASRDLFVEVFDSHPYPAGIDELLEAMPQIVLEDLDDAYADEAESRVPGAGFRTHAFPSPSAELRGVARRVAELLEGGVDAASVYVAAPNRMWERNLKNALDLEGIPVSTMPPLQATSGDVRYLENCTAARIFTALSLAAWPQDPLAWRNWCGFGDYLAHSALMSELAADEILPFLEAIEEKANDSQRLIRDEVDLVAALRSGRFVSDRLRQAFDAGVTGRELLDLASSLTLGVQAEGSKALCPAALVSLCNASEGASAEDMVRSARAKLEAPQFEGEGVKLGSYAHLQGIDSSSVIVTGFVNGFFPTHDFFDEAKLDQKRRERLRDKDLSLVRMLSRKGSDHREVAYFYEAELEEAGALDLKVERIRARGGKRMCDIAASIYLGSL